MFNATTTAYASSLIASAVGATILGISGYNSKTSGQYIQIHDAPSLPADTAIPKVIIYIPALSSYGIDFGAEGRLCAAGIVICNSSTGATKTIGSADCWFDVQYR